MSSKRRFTLQALFLLTFFHSFFTFLIDYFSIMHT
nr:MAG TPA: hypothetical protein [Caudoviricetes sp.]